MSPHRRERLAALAAIGLAIAVPGTRAPLASAQTPSADRSPFTVVLGTAQDGGLPQIAGRAPEDEAARGNPKRRRLVASLLIVDPVSRERFLIDATPDLREQVERADAAAPRPRTTGRPALFDAIALTHAHMGHYAGLMHLGREAYGAGNQRVLASDRMARFLETNGPWDQMVKLRNIAIDRFEADKPIRLNSRLSLTPFVVPHRDEYSDTHGFLVNGPARKILWLPDIDKWERWDRHIEDVIASADVAYIDGTFFDADELPGRAMSEVPHPFITESLQRFGALNAKERIKIVFVHLNHTNPAATPNSKALSVIVKAGMRVARDGERQPL